MLLTYRMNTFLVLNDTVEVPKQVKPNKTSQIFRFMLYIKHQKYSFGFLRVQALREFSLSLKSVRGHMCSLLKSTAF